MLLGSASSSCDYVGFLWVSYTYITDDLGFPRVSWDFIRNLNDSQDSLAIIQIHKVTCDFFGVLWIPLGSLRTLQVPWQYFKFIGLVWISQDVLGLGEKSLGFFGCHGNTLNSQHCLECL